MKKLLVICFAVCSLFFVSLHHSVSAEDSHQTDSPKTVQFTDAQKSELQKIQKRILADKKQLIDKYVEFGALSKEDADKMYTHFEKHYKMMEEHNFQIPPHRPHTQHMPK